MEQRSLLPMLCAICSTHRQETAECEASQELLEELRLRHEGLAAETSERLGETSRQEPRSRPVSRALRDNFCPWFGKLSGGPTRAARPVLTSSPFPGTAASARADLRAPGRCLS